MDWKRGRARKIDKGKDREGRSERFQGEKKKKEERIDPGKVKDSSTS